MAMSGLAYKRLESISAVAHQGHDPDYDNWLSGWGPKRVDSFASRMEYVAEAIEAVFENIAAGEVLQAERRTSDDRKYSIAGRRQCPTRLTLYQYKNILFSIHTDSSEPKPTGDERREFIRVTMALLNGLEIIFTPEPHGEEDREPF